MTAETQTLELHNDVEVFLGKPPNTTDSYDLVMIFPRREGGETKKPHKFTVESYVMLMLGKSNERSTVGEKIVVDEYRRVLRTNRCFFDESGHGIEADAVRNVVADNEKTKQVSLQAKEAQLALEYEQFVGSVEPTTEAIFCELVATAIARRVQLACGLTTRMFRSCDNDELTVVSIVAQIFMTIKADENDLCVEADRSDYQLQVSNRPFDMKVHGYKNTVVREEIGDKEWLASINHLQSTRGSARVGADFPEMDPLLVSHGHEYHPKIHEALMAWGHTEEADGLFITDDRCRRFIGSTWHRLWSSLFSLSYDPMTYFSPFADYRHEAKYQAYYRRYPTKWGEKKEETMFSQKDRIRLAASIIERHLNTDALEAARYSVGLMFALHDEVALQELRSTWALNWSIISQPLNKIRFYFGEKIALYFAWLEFYTKMLLFPSVAGIITFSVMHSRRIEGNIQGYILIGFALFVVAWSTVFSEFWRRKNGLLNVLWGLHGYHRKLRYRAQFRGTKCYNDTTDQEEMTYEDKSRRQRAFLVSTVVVLLMVGITIVALVALFLLKRWINEVETSGDYHVEKMYRSSLTMSVTCANAVQILVLNMVYRNVAHKLNEWENHRTDSEFDNHLVIKVFLFQFCNSFASFFYIAFVKRTTEGSCLYENDCMKELRDQLLILFLIRIVVGNTLEVVIPYLKYRYQLYKERDAVMEKVAFIEERGSAPQRKTTTSSNLTKRGHNYIEEQAKLVPYESNESFEDYNEMVIQYGFITLFVVAFPLTPLLAFANNVLEVHVDAIKLCFVHRRPFPHAAKNIGAWFYILRFMSYISLATNAALILWTSNLFGESMNNTTKGFVYVVAVQVCMMVVVFIENIVPDTPQELVLLMQRNEYIVDTVFKGLHEGDDSHLKETAEALDLTIYPNSQWSDKVPVRIKSVV